MSNQAMAIGTGCLGALLAIQAACAAPPKLAGLRARHASGQTFVMWDEADLAPTQRLAVWRHTKPITPENVERATLLCRDLMPGTSCDLSDLRKAEYDRFKPLPTEGVRGAVVPWGGAVVEGEVVPGRIEPYNGLYVHTPTRDGLTYYAVAVVDDAGARQTEIVPGATALAEPVAEVATKELVPIQVAGPPAEQLRRERPDKRAMFVVLHAITGFQHDAKARKDMQRRAPKGDEPTGRDIRAIVHYVTYGTKDHGWRAGLPFQWSVYDTPQWWELWLDDSNFAFMGFDNAFWFGVNRNLTRPSDMAEGVVGPTNENNAMWTVRWMLRHWPVDPDRLPMYGSSMGGAGNVSISVRHPAYFSGLEQNVPPVNTAKIPSLKGYGPKIWGPLDKLAKAAEGGTVWERLDSARQLREHPVRLPPALFTAGRTDKAVPWEYMVPYFRLVQEQGQPVVIVWDNQGHGRRTLWDKLPEARDHLTWIHETSRREPVLAFAYGTANDDPGDGSQDSGAKVGTINLYYHGKIKADTPRRFEADYWYERDGRTDGGTTDVIPCRLQAFPRGKGRTVRYAIRAGDEVVRDGTVTIDNYGVYRIQKAPCDRRYTLVLTATK